MKASLAVIHSHFNAQGHGRLLFVLAMLTAFSPLATDMYLSAFTQMTTDLGSNHGDIELTLSIYFLGLAIGQAIYGPLIDCFGRRLPLLIGTFMFAAASLGATLTSDLQVFTALRLIQALGGCAGMVVGRAIVNDMFDATESARALSLLQMLSTLAPIIAPLAGAWILMCSGWRTIFLAMLVFAMASWMMAWRHVPETLPKGQRQPLRLGHIIKSYSVLMRCRTFVVPTMAGGLAQSCMFAFITGSPSVLMEVFGVSESMYGWLFGLVAIGLIAGAQFNRIALRRWSVTSLLGAALLSNLASCLVLLSTAGTNHLVIFMVPLWLAITSLGFIGGNATAIAMAASGPNAGSGSALIGALQFGMAFVASTAVSSFKGGTSYPMVLAMLSAAFTAAGLWFIDRRFLTKTLG